MCEYDYKPEEIIAVGDDVFVKIEIIKSMVEDLKTTANELTEILKENAELVKEIRMELPKFQ